MQVSLPPEKFNEAARDGSVGKKMSRILEDAKPKAVYFTAKDGRRGGYIVVDVAHAADMPRLAEPWFLNFNATVEFLPVMTPEDLQKAGVEELAKRWG